LQMKALWKDSTIYSFEPIPYLYQEVSEKIKNLPGINLSQKALAEITGKRTFFVSSGASKGSSSLLPPQKHLEVHPKVTFGQTIDVETITIDDWVKNFNIPKVDLMWLDLQGAEFQVLQAAEKTLTKTTCIFTEVSLIETYKGVTLYPEYKLWLEAKGFKVVWEDISHQDMGNVLFVKL
jgi:FkbM family methyltransferase